MRQFIRHPTAIPIALQVASLPRRPWITLRDISLGGISCQVDEAIPVGSQVSINIGSVSPPYNGKGQVVWCLPRACRFDVGVAFHDSAEAFRVRMVEQVCQIEEYRRAVLAREGRTLDSEQAALEWIGKYAADFPR